MTRILLIDDDTELVSLLREYLIQDGFSVTTASDGALGAAEALSGGYAIVVLDVMMPRLNGLDALRHIRRESTLPVLMLTARGDDADRITGLELGADDYVTKPCTPRELVARLRAILRRTTPGAAPGRPAGPLTSLGGPRFTANGRTLPWRRDAVDLNAFSVDIPAGVTSLEADLEILTAPAPDGVVQGLESPRTATESLLILEWHQLMLYPAGTRSDDLSYQASVLPLASHLKRIDLTSAGSYWFHH